MGAAMPPDRPARAVIASRTYPTTIDDLWDALINPIRIPRWFLPISGDLRLGDRYQLHGNAAGTITEGDPPRVVKATRAGGHRGGGPDHDRLRRGPRTAA